MQNLTMSYVETVPCKICGNKTGCIETKLCDDCWEVTCRLSSFLDKRNGVAYVKELLESKLAKKPKGG